MKAFTIDMYAFSHCSFEELVIDEGVEEIWGAAFAYCNVEALYLPRSLKVLSSAFRGVTEIYYNGTMADWGAIDKSRWNEIYTDYYVKCIDGDVCEPPFYDW